MQVLLAYLHTQLCHTHYMLSCLWQMTEWNSQSVGYKIIWHMLVWESLPTNMYCTCIWWSVLLILLLPWRSRGYSGAWCRPVSLGPVWTQSSHCHALHNGTNSTKWMRGFHCWKTRGDTFICDVLTDKSITGSRGLYILGSCLALFISHYSLPVST